MAGPLQRGHGAAAEDPGAEGRRAGERRAGMRGFGASVVSRIPSHAAIKEDLYPGETNEAGSKDLVLAGLRVDVQGDLSREILQRACL